MYKWLLIPPDRATVDDAHYANEKLEEIMVKYRKNQSEAAAMFEKRKRDMTAKPIEGSDTPYIEPGDENSKFYTKPDVPPIPHPAEVLERLQKEFPDKEMAELVQMADAEVAAEIERRRAETGPNKVEVMNDDGTVKQTLVMD
jgi:Glu-tRNA(Gln) amidotransferase subunit E-like FAD-binding protein